MKKKTLMALTAAGMTLAKAHHENSAAVPAMTKKEQKALFIKNKTDEFVKAGHSRPFAQSLARIAYKNSLRK